MAPATRRSARSRTSMATALPALSSSMSAASSVIGAKPVAVPVSDLEFMRGEDGDVHAVTNWIKDQLKAMPEHIDP